MNHPFTDTYIAMAKAAAEIQAMRKDTSSWNMGDFSVREVYGEGEDGLAIPMVQVMGGTQFDGLDFPLTSEPLIFLPRLDQLLGMLGALGDPEGFIGMLGYRPADNEYSARMDRGYNRFLDWHELALAVVMRERYGKTWRDGQWVKV